MKNASGEIMKTAADITNEFVKKLNKQKFLLKRDTRNDMLLCGRKPKVIKSSEDGRIVKIGEINFEDGICSITDLKGKNWNRVAQLGRFIDFMKFWIILIMAASLGIGFLLEPHTPLNAKTVLIDTPYLLGDQVIIVDPLSNFSSPRNIGIINGICTTETMIFYHVVTFDGLPYTLTLKQLQEMQPTLEIQP
jgi:hypothetical protein